VFIAIVTKTIAAVNAIITAVNSQIGCRQCSIVKLRHIRVLVDILNRLSSRWLVYYCISTVCRRWPLAAGVVVGCSFWAVVCDVVLFVVVSLGCYLWCCCSDWVEGTRRFQNQWKRCFLLEAVVFYFESWKHSVHYYCAEKIKIIKM